MKNFKINVDRPELTSSEIMSKQNFEEVLAGHKFMSKPFYKSSWFLGTAGLASLGLIVGGALSFKMEPDEPSEFQELTLKSTDAPPKLDVKVIPISNYLNQNLESDLGANPAYKSPKTELAIAYETTSTQEINDKNINEVPPPKEEELEKTISPDVPKSFSRLDLSPRISGKLNGDITRVELLDSKGLVTNSDVEVVSFELHIIDEDGGHVYAQEGHELSEEMKNSIKNISAGQTIYFEKIIGESKNGVVVKLNPLRYTVY